MDQPVHCSGTMTATVKKGPKLRFNYFLILQKTIIGGIIGVRKTSI